MYIGYRIYMYIYRLLNLFIILKMLPIYLAKTSRSMLQKTFII